MPKRDDTSGPYIRWLDYGAYEGWKPTSYDTLIEALTDINYGNNFTITKLCKFKIEDMTDAQS